MQLSEQHITQFQMLYAEKFGREISRAEALDMGTKLVRLLQLVYKPVTKEQFELAKKRQKEFLAGLGFSANP